MSEDIGAGSLGPPSRSESSIESGPQVRTAVEITVRLGIIALLVAWCLMIVAPFVGIVAWALIIALGASGPYEKLRDLLGGREKTAASLFVVIALLALIVPAVLLSETLATGAQRFAAEIASGEIRLPPPPAKLAEVPIVGQPVHDAWELAYSNLEEALVRLKPQLTAVSRWLLHAAGSAGIGLLQLVASLLIAGVMLARSKSRDAAVLRFMSRLAGPVRGPDLANTATMTVQSVVQGIVGVAVIQSVLAAAGFVLIGIPGAGLWALLVLISAVVQLPVALVMVPPILIGFSIASPPVAVVFAIWCIIVALVDNVLKPILFGRGVKVPTVVIFLGAIGGMMTMGIIGLFLGAVVLALGFELFMAWLNETEADEEAAA